MGSCGLRLSSTCVCVSARAHVRTHTSHGRAVEVTTTSLFLQNDPQGVLRCLHPGTSSAHWQGPPFRAVHPRTSSSSHPGWYAERITCPIHWRPHSVGHSNLPIWYLISDATSQWGWTKSPHLHEILWDSCSLIGSQGPPAREEGVRLDSYS